jgi:hypothetical protein
MKSNNDRARRELNQEESLRLQELRIALEDKIESLKEHLKNEGKINEETVNKFENLETKCT